MSFANPWLLLLLPGIAGLFLLRWWWNARLLRAAAPAGVGAQALTPTMARARSRLRSALLAAGLGCIAVAAAGPRWGASEEARTRTGADVLVLLDCSRSMLAPDLHPDRMTAARRKALRLLELAPDLRLALMPFAADAVLRCPLTGDRAALELMIADCSPELFPADAGLQGTAIGAGVQRALEVLGRQVERGQAILVLTDGDDPDEATVDKAAQAARDAGVPVFGILAADPDAKATVSLDGREVAVPGARATIDRLATATGGAAATATTDDADLNAILAAIDAGVARRPWEERRRITASERYQHPLTLGILLLAIALLIPQRRRP